MLFQYFSFFFKANPKKGFGVHSPFVYSFVNKVINDKSKENIFFEIHKYRTNLLKSDSEIEVQDLGAGSKKMKESKRKIRDIVKFSATPKKNAELLYKMIKYFESHRIIELGTSLGIGTLYLSHANPHAHIHTIEADKNTFLHAQKTFNLFNCKNIHAYNDTFENALPNILLQIKEVDMVYIDGHHDGEATLKYYNMILPFCHNDTIIVLDDIRWSKDMYQAWSKIILDNNVTASLDLFFQGIVFFRKEMQKQCFMLKI